MDGPVDIPAPPGKAAVSSQQSAASGWKLAALFASGGTRVGQVGAHLEVHPARPNRREKPRRANPGDRTANRHW